MKPVDRVSLCSWLAPLLGALLFVELSAAQSAPPPPQYPDLPSESPAKFTPTTDTFDYVRRDVMIPMRDGVKLHTVILVPKGAKGAPILLTRTPYDATGLTSHAQSSHLGPVLNGYDNATEVIVEGGYIRAVQDVRGKHGSEGDYVMNRPLHGPQNPTPVDHSTDTYDTIYWLVKNVPETNGKVGILGISYDGFLPLMALVNPHPALKVSVPMNPMVDGWMGDDWFHNGAFRQPSLAYIYDQEATRKSEIKWWTSHFDEYDTYMEAGSAGALGQRRGLEPLGFWRKILAHPGYDAFWRDQAMDRVLAEQPLKVPVMLVHSPEPSSLRRTTRVIWIRSPLLRRSRCHGRDVSIGLARSRFCSSPGHNVCSRALRTYFPSTSGAPTRRLPQPCRYWRPAMPRCGSRRAGDLPTANCSAFFPASARFCYVPAPW